MLYLPAATALEIDGFRYPSSQAAVHAWRPMANAPPPAQVGPGALQFQIPFAGDRDRVYWDRTVSLDLSGYDTFVLELTCPHPETMRSLAIYLKSGNGWYIWNRPLPEPGRQTLYLMKSDFETEGNPEGWDHIEIIRLSPWRGTPRNTTLTLHRFSALNPSVLLVRGNGLNAGEQQVAQRTAQRLQQWIAGAGIPHTVIDQDKLSNRRLSRSRIMILSYSPTLTADQHRLVASFMEAGGKVMVFYSSDDALAQLMGFRLGAYQAAEVPGRWVAMAFEDAGRQHLPERVFQESWNIRPALPDSRDARVLAWWENAHGERTSDPAWTASDRGLWMSHILLQGDDTNKSEMLAGLLARMDPSLWSVIAQQAVARAGKVGPFSGVDEAVQGLERAAPHSERTAQIAPLLRQARELNERMHHLHQQQRYPESVHTQRAVNRTLLEAYARAQSPKRGELRGVWDHSGTGLYPGDWDRTARLLSEKGINALFVNLLWGGVAHYASDVLPRSATFRMHGDQLEQCLRAARKHGLEVHVWIVCWNLTGAPADFVQQMQTTGRTMQDAEGRSLPWLNPAHPENVRLMVDSLKEIAERYDVDGIHLDYIRYPNRRACYADYTRQRFEEWTGRRVARWPADALPGGALDSEYRRFRVEQINHAVRAVHEGVRPVRPEIKISAAVWGGYPDVIHSIGQDWAPWLVEGTVDFVTPMNYASDTARFTHLTRSQFQLPDARGRIMPGIGVTSSESQLRPDQVIQQILAARELGATGWVLFDLNPTVSTQTLPALHLGITR